MSKFPSKFITAVVYLSTELAEDEKSLLLVMHSECGDGGWRYGAGCYDYGAGITFEIVELTSAKELRKTLREWCTVKYIDEVKCWITITEDGCEGDDLATAIRTIEQTLPKSFF